MIPGILSKYNTRPSIHAYHAGTRGFRAPEVLFRVKDQTGGNCSNLTISY